MADPVEVDCANSAHSVGHPRKEMENCSLSNVTYLVDNLSKFDQDTNMDNEYGAEVNLLHGFSNERQEELQERLTCNQQPTEAEDEHDGGDKSTIECIKTVLDLSVENISKKRQSLDSVAQVVREFFPLAKLLVSISMCCRQLFSSSDKLYYAAGRM